MVVGKGIFGFLFVWGVVIYRFCGVGVSCVYTYIVWFMIMKDLQTVKALNMDR